MSTIYCNSLTNYSRFVTREVSIGGLLLGGNNPIRLQSMTSTLTMDTQATVAQCIRMIEAGCELIRITAPNVKEATQLGLIKKELRAAGFNTPLIADIHFQPKAADVAATLVEKIRINPGNYIDRNLGRLKVSESDYKTELDRVRACLKPLLRICKDHGTVIRIGSNHGSLSDRIMSKYGDTPMGMVEAAMEFVRICADLDFHELVISMKASNTWVMVESNRLLVNKMIGEGYNYPIHLGVTEAGEGEDGRIKSAAGIATLLEDGIGDTIRVSLTEDPEFEIPVAKALADRYTNRISNPIPPVTSSPISPFEYHKRETIVVGDIGGDKSPVVILSENELSSNHTYLYANQQTLTPSLIEEAKKTPNAVFIFESNNPHVMPDFRRLFISLLENECKTPVIIKRHYAHLTPEQLQLVASADVSGLFIDGLGNGLWLTAEGIDTAFIEKTILGILQACRLKYSKTEYISCPSCGRTQYNIQEAVAKIKARTSHLKGLKIGIMGCIVNGPGEMADADYGYVGAGGAFITLFKKREIMKKNLPVDTAVDELIQLIKDNGDWVNPA